MNKYGLYIIMLSAILSLHVNPTAFTQEDDAMLERDPFIPLLDDKGNLRKQFIKPSLQTSAPQVVLMGISKVGNTYYAMIDTELVKEGQVFKDMTIEKIYADRVIVLYGDKTFELKWETEQK